MPCWAAEVPRGTKCAGNPPGALPKGRESPNLLLSLIPIHAFTLSQGHSLPGLLCVLGEVTKPELMKSQLPSCFPSPAVF